MAALLNSDTLSIDFGNVTINTTVTTQIVLTCGGDDGLAVEFPDVVSDPQFTENLMSLGVIFSEPGVSAMVTVTFTPTALGTQSATITYTGNFSNFPLVIPVTGVGIAVGSQALSVSPSSGFTFPNTVNGSSSPEQLFVLTNSGTVAFNITALAFNGVFAAGPTQPVLPYTLAPGATVNVGVIFSPNANEFFNQTDGLVITSQAMGSPMNIALGGLGIPFIPAYILSGQFVVALIAFNTAAVGTAGSVIQQFGQSLASEVQCSTDRLINFQNPTFENVAYNVQVDYEDLGPATLKVQLTTRRGQIVSQTIAIGTVSANEDILYEIFNIQVSDEVVHIQIIQIAGPISICGYTVYSEPAGEIRKDA